LGYPQTMRIECRPATKTFDILFHTLSVMYALGVGMTFEPVGTPCFKAKFPLKVAWSIFYALTRKK
jgi:hypothetical protein